IELQKKLPTEDLSARGLIPEIPYEIHTDYDADVFDAVAEMATDATKEAMAIADKSTRNGRLDEILEGVLLALCGTPDEPQQYASRATQIKPAFRALPQKAVRS